MKNKIKKSLGNLSKKVTTANKIKTPDSKTMLDIMIEDNKKAIWVTQVELYCVELDITPADLIETHRQSLKVAKKGKKQGKDEEIKEAKEQISNWRSDYIKKKTGISLLPEKIKDPYKNQ